MKLKEYRGHIRNWKTLCEELGIQPASERKEREETIILKAFERWGDEVGLHLIGMFAFALEDEETGEIFACRDPFGTKPFYYYLTEEGNLLCGTYIRPILAEEGFQIELNKDMLQLYLTLTYVAGENTFFRGLKKLMPGHTLRFSNGNIAIKRYFRPTFAPDDTRTLQEWAEEINETVRHIMTEVKEPDEVAESFLSGGVDSSYVLAMSDAKTADTIGYDDERFDESPLAKQTADGLGVTLNRLRVTPEEYFAIVPWVMENMEQPLADAFAIAFALGCRATAQHTKLCYSGEGSDEFFGGYNMYRNAERYGDNLKTFYVGNTNIMKEDEKKQLLKYYNDEILPIDLVKDIYEENEGMDPLTKMQDVDIRIWLEGDIYFNVDKMSTAAGLEIRMPLTDPRVFAIASRLPAKYKIDDEQNKVAFRNAAKEVIPEEVAFRKKLGFIVPIRHWMADANYNQDVYEKLHGKTAEQFFHMDVLDAIWQEYLGGNSDLWRKIWTIYTFLVWYDIYF